MPENGALQICKISAAESSYGADATGFAIMGVVDGGEIGSKMGDNRIYGIGSQSYQARYPGVVENDLKVSLVCPTPAMIMKGITRTNGELASYNVAVGKDAAAWQGVGFKFNNIDFEGAADSLLKVSMEGMFKSKKAALSTETGHSPGTIGLWQPEGMVLSIAGSPDVDVVSWTGHVKNNLSRVGVANSSNTPKRTIKYLKEGPLECDVTVQTLSRPSFDLEADCPSRSLTLTVVYTDLCAQGTPSSMTITWSGGSYIEKREPLKPNDYIEYSIGLSFSSVAVT